MNLKVTIIQFDIIWENADENLKLLSEKIESLSDDTDIIILPEMFNTGFSMDSEKLAETMDGKTVGWMKEIAKRSNAVVVGSLIIEEHQKYFNRLVWMQPNGEYFTYDKRHLFRMAGEHEHFSAGEKRLIVKYKGWRICPLVCYDLRFPVWSRNEQLSGNQQQRTNNKQQNSNVFDILIYIANWPEVRKQPWSKLLEARAIENQCYVVGVNRVGIDGTEKNYSGNSVVINPKGEAITNIPENENYVTTTSLSLDDINAFRKVFPVGLDGDKFELIL